MTGCTQNSPPMHRQQEARVLLLTLLPGRCSLHQCDSRSTGSLAEQAVLIRPGCPLTSSGSAETAIRNTARQRVLRIPLAMAMVQPGSLASVVGLLKEPPCCCAVHTSGLGALRHAPAFLSPDLVGTVPRG